MTEFKEQKGSAHVIIIVILVVVIVGLLGFVFWQNFINKSSTAADTKVSGATSKSTKSANSESLTNTKVYKSTVLGFALNYPSDWEMRDGMSGTSEIAKFTSPTTAGKRSTAPNETQYDVSVVSEPKSGSSNGSSVAVMALKGNAAIYASKKYTETINSISVTEFDISDSQVPFFAAIFAIDNNYVELDFLGTPTRADMTAALTSILQSVHAL